MRFTLLLLAITGSNLVYANYSNTKMTCLVNQERAKRGLGALGIDSRLTNAAQSHSNDQARRRQMTHTGSDGSDPGRRVTRAGFTWRAVAENVAYGYSDEVSCMKEWMNSSGHRANILGNYEMFGSAVAYAGNTPYYTQNFGTDSQGRRNIPNCSGSDYGSDYGNDNNGDYNDNNSGNYGGNNGGDYGGNNNMSYGGNKYSGGNNNYGGSYGQRNSSGNYGNRGGNKSYGGNYGQRNSGGSYGGYNGGNKSYGKRFGGWPNHRNHHYTTYSYSHY